MFNLDLSGVQSVGGNSPITLEQVTVQVESVEIKNNKAGNGQYFSVKFNVLAPASVKGRKIFNMYNIANPNQQAVDIGLAQLKELVQAGGGNVSAVSPATINGLTLDLKLGVKSDQFGDKNVIKRHLKSTLNAIPKNEIPF